MKLTSKVKSVDQQEKFFQDLKNLGKLQVYVGIPEDSAARKDGGVTNAQLAFLHTQGVRESDMRSEMLSKIVKGATYGKALAMYLHTHGSPLWQIPPRPIIEPAIEAKGNREAILAELKKAAEATLEGKKPEAIRALQRAGLTAQNRVRAWFTDPRNGWAPNAPSTIKAKGSAQPLIDHGELRRSITYVVVGG